MKIILLGLIQKVYRFRAWGSENCRFALANKPIGTPLRRKGYGISISYFLHGPYRLEIKKSVQQTLLQFFV